MVDSFYETEEPRAQEATQEQLAPSDSIVPTPARLRSDIPTVSPTKRQSRTHTPVPEKLPEPPLMKSTSASEVTGGAIWRADLSQQGYDYMLGLVKELKKTNLGSIDITFGIPSNMNRGTVIHSGGGREESINPDSKRVTNQNPMINRAVIATGNMDIRNIEAQGRELQSELSRRLKVPVSLHFQYNSNIGVLFRFMSKKRR